MSGAERDAHQQRAEPIELRARPRPVTRLNKRALAVASASALLLVFGAMSLALRPPRAADEGARRELYNVESKPAADGLEALPKTYADIAVNSGAPSPPSVPRPSPFDAEQDAAGEAMAPPARRAPQGDEEIFARPLAREAEDGAPAREAGVFFELSARGAPKALPGSAGQAGEPQGGGRLPFGAERSEDPSRQIAKMRFLAEEAGSETDNPHAIEDPASPFEVLAGTVIPASLVTGVNSDLPGTVIAQVTQNVYDTATGQYILIPQGARLVGRYDSVVAFGQSRALLVWSRLLFPDGASVLLDNAPASDAAGYAGLSDRVDFHTFRLLKGVALSTMLGVGAELAFDDRQSDLVEALREAAQGSATMAGQRIVERNLDIQPTIKVRPGWPLRVLVHKDLVLRPYGGPRPF